MRIECPECSQRFNVDDHLKGETVECGSCDHQFELTDDVRASVKTRSYPGEKAGVDLNRFAPRLNKARAPEGFTEAHYDADFNMAKMAPLGARRTLAVVAGILLMVLVIVVFLLAGGKTGGMRDMETLQRFVLVGFTAIMGGGLLIYGMVKSRLIGVLLALILGGALCALPVIFPGNPMKSAAESLSSEVDYIEGSNSIVSDDEGSEEDYLNQIGYYTVEDLLESEPKEEVFAIFMRDSTRIYRDKIRSFIYDATDKKDRGIIYERGENEIHGLYVILDQTMPFDEMSKLCSSFGTVNKVMEGQRLIDVTIDQEKLNILDEPAALDPENLKFQSSNLKLLSSLDPIAKLAAVKRLGNSEPVAFRYDVVDKLVELLPNSNPELQRAIIETLRIWSQPADGVEPVVLEVVRDLFLTDELDSASVAFLVERKVVEASLIVIELWDKDPIKWADLLEATGEGAEVLLLPRLADMDVLHITSAAGILNKVASASAIPTLTKVKSGKKGQSAKILQACIDEIKNRL